MKTFFIQQLEICNFKAGYGYVSQLYVGGMVSLHLIYHPVDAEYKGQMSLEGSYWGLGWGVSLQHLVCDST